MDVSVFHLDTRDAFHDDGDIRAFNPFTQAHAVSTSAFATVAMGLVPGLDAWVQVPFQRLRFDDLGGDRLRTGIGDTRFYLRVQPGRYLGSRFPLAIRGGAKVPVGDFAVDAEIIPLGDGQRDWELVLELGHSFYPVPAYVSAWIGHRWREQNLESRRDFGDEVFFLLSGESNSDAWERASSPRAGMAAFRSSKGSGSRRHPAPCCASRPPSATGWELARRRPESRFLCAVPTCPLATRW